MPAACRREGLVPRSTAAVASIATGIAEMISALSDAVVRMTPYVSAV